ncbi:hypothetical protein KUCAC02_033328, partial [Chaenocephalus aceratus]
GQGSLLRFISREKWNRLQTAGGGGRSVPDKASTLSLYRIRGRGRCWRFIPVKSGTDFRLQEEEVGVCQIRPLHYLYIGSGAGVVVAFYPVKSGTDFRLQEEEVGVCQIRPLHYLYIGS